MRSFTQITQMDNWQHTHSKVRTLRIFHSFSAPRTLLPLVSQWVRSNCYAVSEYNERMDKRTNSCEFDSSISLFHHRTQRRKNQQQRLLNITRTAHRQRSTLTWNALFLLENWLFWSWLFYCFYIHSFPRKIARINRWNIFQSGKNVVEYWQLPHSNT